MNDCNEFGLPAYTMELIFRVFAGFPEIDEVIIFGSRAEGKGSNGSDIDLAIKGKDIDKKLTDVIRNLLQEGLYVPYFFDVVNYNSLQPGSKFKLHIDSYGKVFYKNRQQS